MTDREKYRTRGGFYLFARNQPKAIEELTALVKQFPADDVGYGDLALAYFYDRSMSKALEVQKQSLDLAPHSVLQRINFAMYALYAGDFDTAAKEAQSILNENPKFDQALRTLARPQSEKMRASKTSLSYVPSDSGPGPRTKIFPRLLPEA